LPSEAWSGSRLETRVADIVASVGRIRSYIKGYDLEVFSRDDKTRAAVERELEIISEACTKIRYIEEQLDIKKSQTLEARLPNIPWAKIRGIGNRLRHEYGRIDPKVIWETVAGRELRDLGRALKRSVVRRAE
jgi:uncharacterized protein with HEPN domain